jgi:pilus assembly protein CpaF
VQPPERVSSPGRPPTREQAPNAGKRLGLITLVDRVAEVMDLSILSANPVVDDAIVQSLEQATRGQAQAMRDEGEAPDGIDVAALVREAMAELTGLGCLSPLLDDEEVSAIQCFRHDQVVFRTAAGVSPVSVPFTSEDALIRAIARIANQAGEPLRPGETLIDRRLPRGARMSAVLAPTSSAAALTIRKRRRAETSLDELVKNGMLSKPMATFLEHCMAARANVAVLGPSGDEATALLGALMSSPPPGTRVCILQDEGNLNITHPHGVSIGLPDDGARGEETVHASFRLGADRFVVGALGGRITAAVLENIVAGARGVVVLLAATSLRQGLARLATQVLMARPGLTLEAARETVAEAFDIAIEIGRASDGRPRIARIAEFAGVDAKGLVARDVFLASEGLPGPDGPFVPSGVVPRVVGEFAARGVKVDPTLFKRR